MTGWAQDAVFYHLFPLGLCGAPERNDLAGPNEPRLERLLPWLEHARGLGASALLLGPVFESGSHGYDTVDLGRVDRRLGTNEDLARLIAAAHRLGMRVILDAVFGHVGREFGPFRDVRERGEGSRYRGWFRGLRFGGRSPLGDPFTYECWKDAWELVRLEQGHAEVRDHLFGAVEGWVRDYDVDGLRLDTADWLDADFLRALRERCDRLKPDFWLMGEVVHGDYRRQAGPGMLHAVTNYECSKGLWSSFNDRNLFEIAYALNRQFGPGGIYRGLPLYAFVDNHDVNRVASELRDRGHLFPLYGLLLTMPGAPSIYYGSEWGLEGRRTPHDDRALRPALDLGQMRERGDGALVDAIRRLAGVRHGSPALRRGDYAQLQVAAEQLVFERRAPEERVLVAINGAAAPAAVEVPVPGARRLVDLLDPGPGVEVAGGRARLELHGRWLRILRAE